MFSMKYVAVFVDQMSLYVELILVSGGQGRTKRPFVTRTSNEVK